jgi:hypothetical protein
MVLVAVTAIAAGTFGPIYLSEADHSVLLSTLRAAPPGNDGLTLIPSSPAGSLAALLRASDAVPREPDGRAYFAAPIVTADLGVTATTSPTSNQAFQSDLVSRTGVCRHLSFTSGGCPLSTGSVAMSTRSAAEMGLRTGDSMTVFPPRQGPSVVLTVSGIFRPGSSRAPFWWGNNFFPFGQGSPRLPLIDDLFASQQTVLAASPARQVFLLVQRPLVTDALTPGNVAAVQSALSGFEGRSRSLFGVGASTQLPGLLGRAAQVEHTTGTIVVVVDLQLVLLSLLVLYFVAARTAEAREPDVRLAELRGFSPSDAASVALLEPVVVLGAAVPVGIVVAWLAAVIASPHLFVAGVAPAVGPLAVGSALLSFVAGVMATVLGARQLILRPRTARHAVRGGSAAALVVDAVAVAIAVVAFVEVAAAGVSNGSHTDPLAAFAPGLLAFGLGVVAARVVPLLSRLAISPTRGSRAVGTTLAVRRVARRAELSRHIVVMSLAIGLVTFAVAGWSIAGHNRFLQSGFDVGAAHVLTVEAHPGVDFLAAVRRADPTGTQAMAVVIENAPDGALLAVDARRLADVASWPSTLSPTNIETIARRLVPATAPPVLVSGAALRVSLDVLDTAVPAPELEAMVFDPGYEAPSTIDLGPLEVGRHSYEAPMAGDCEQACRLVDLGITWSAPASAPQQSITASVVVSSVADRSATGPWSVVPTGLGDPRRWDSGSGGVTIGRSVSGLAVDATVDNDGAPATFGPADVPRTLPAVVTSPGGSSVGLDGAVITVKAVDAVSALPVVGNDNSATMVDLPLVERLQSGPMTNATLEVWLAADAGPGIVARLAREGITVVGVRTVAGEVSTLSKTGVSLAYVLFLLAAIAAAVLAVGSTIFTVSVSARRRTVELASLHAVGVSERSLRRSLALEQLVVLGVGLLAGFGAGLIATRVALPSVPEYFTLGPGPPLAYGLPWGAMAVILLAVIVSLGVTAVLAARLVVGRASADKLGGEQ